MSAPTRTKTYRWTPWQRSLVLHHLQQACNEGRRVGVKRFQERVIDVEWQCKLTLTPAGEQWVRDLVLNNPEPV